MEHVTHLRQANDEGVSQAALVLDLPLHIGPKILHKLACTGSQQQIKPQVAAHHVVAMLNPLLLARVSTADKDEQPESSLPMNGHMKRHGGDSGYVQHKQRSAGFGATEHSLSAA